MRIVFMGSPDFAVPSLEILVQNGYNVVAVVTATDKYGGRGGKQLLETDVKKYAVSQDIPVLQPKNLKSTEFIDELRSYKADLQIVVAFRMLPVVVWDMPELGTYNLHGSLLPQYRGAAPINWAIINGESVTGVTSFKLKHAIDTGDYLLQKEIPIDPDETAGELYHRMKYIGAEVILDTVKAIENKNISLHPQDENLVSKAPKIFHDTCEIDWSKPIEEVYNFIRGLSPYPAAWTTIDGKVCKIMRCKKLDKMIEKQSGTLVTDQKTKLLIAAKGGYIQIEEIKMQGKRALPIDDFLNGYEIKDRVISYRGSIQ